MPVLIIFQLICFIIHTCYFYAGGAYRFQIAAVYSNNDNKSGPISAKFILLKDPPMEKPSKAPFITFAEAASPSAITLHWEVL